MIKDMRIVYTFVWLSICADIAAKVYRDVTNVLVPALAITDLTLTPVRDGTGPRFGPLYGGSSVWYHNQQRSRYLRKTHCLDQSSTRNQQRPFAMNDGLSITDYPQQKYKRRRFGRTTSRAHYFVFQFAIPHKFPACVALPSCSLFSQKTFLLSVLRLGVSG
ncbi:hypothetical protein JB92DRAFT_2835818 [Gautieria morchelliformis]|nr:hypothetical protein JB92DRAFT_2835818 [Gautieria morchelliformis]